MYNVFVMFICYFFSWGIHIFHFSHQWSRMNIFLSHGRLHLVLHLVRLHMNQPWRRWNNQIEREGRIPHTGHRDLAKYPLSAKQQSASLWNCVTSQRRLGHIWPTPYACWKKYFQCRNHWRSKSVLHTIPFGDGIMISMVIALIATSGRTWLSSTTQKNPTALAC